MINEWFTIEDKMPKDKCLVCIVKGFETEKLHELWLYEEEDGMYFENGDELSNAFDIIAWRPRKDAVLGESVHSQNTKPSLKEGEAIIGEARSIKSSDVIEDTKSDINLGESEQ